MHVGHRSLASLLVLALLSAPLFPGCGGGGGRDIDDCGNGSLDDGEVCDDGNLADDDACLSTCELAVCGDGYVQKDVEQCDLFVAVNCAQIGFASGTLECGSDCRFDTSGCRGTSGPTATPNGGATATPIPSGDVPTSTASVAGPTPTTLAPTPTALPTPVGALCTGTESIAVVIALDAEVTSARVDLAYSPSVNVPGTGIDASVKERVEFTGSGLTVVNDFDDDGDLTDDTLTTSLVGTDVVPPGTFVTVTFDCLAGAAKPAAGDFGCTVVSASNAGTSVTASCSVAVQ